MVVRCDGGIYGVEFGCQGARLWDWVDCISTTFWHSGNTLAAATGASTKELMARMGHVSPRAALIYQHGTADRDAAIARALSDLVNSSVQQAASALPKTRTLRLVKGQGTESKSGGGETMVL